MSNPINPWYINYNLIPQFLINCGIKNELYNNNKKYCICINKKIKYMFEKKKDQIYKKVIDNIFK